MINLVKKTYNLEDFTHEGNVKPYFETAHGFVCFENINKIGIGIGGARGTGDVYVRKTTATASTASPTTPVTVVDITTDGFERLDGKLTMTQYSIGPQLGGKVYSQIIFFETERDLKNFAAITMKTATERNEQDSNKGKAGGGGGGGVYEFGVDANIVALMASAGANVSTIGNETISTRVNYGGGGNNKDGTDATNKYNYEFRLNDTLAYNKGLAVFTITVGGFMFETCFSGQHYKYEESTTTPPTAEDNNDNEDYIFASTEHSTTTTTAKDEKNEDQQRTKDISSTDEAAAATTTSSSSSPLAVHVENLQKFAYSMKNQFVEKVEKIQTKKDNKINAKNDDKSTTTETNTTTTTKNGGVGGGGDNTSSDRSGKENITTDNNDDDREFSRPFKSGLKTTTEEHKKTNAIGLAPVAPGEADRKSVV